MGLSNGTQLTAKSSSLILKAPTSGLAYASSVAPPVSAATWSATDKNANITITGSGLIATDGGAAANHTGRGTTATTTIGAGIKRFFKVVPTNITGFAAGICNASFVFTDGNYLGVDANGLGWFPTGQVFRSGALLTTIASYVQGDTLGFAVTGAGNLWGSVNGVFTGDPVAGTGGIDISAMGDVFPAYTLQGGGIATALFAASDPPSGFSIFP